MTWLRSHLLSLISGQQITCQRQSVRCCVKTGNCNEPALCNRFLKTSPTFSHQPGFTSLHLGINGRMAHSWRHGFVDAHCGDVDSSGYMFGGVPVKRAVLDVFKELQEIVFGIVCSSVIAQLSEMIRKQQHRRHRAVQTQWNRPRVFLQPPQNAR